MKTCRQNSDACAIDHRAAVQEKTERDGTREVLPRTTTTLVVLKAAAYHTHTPWWSPRDRDRAAFKQTTASEGWQDCRTFVFTAVQFSVQSSETAKPDVDGYTAWMVLLFIERADSFQRKTVVNRRFTTCAGRVFTSLCQDSRKYAAQRR